EILGQVLLENAAPVHRAAEPRDEHVDEPRHRGEQEHRRQHHLDHLVDLEHLRLVHALQPFFVLDRTHATTSGSRLTTTMPMMSRVRLPLTHGMLPKKYPA